MSDKVDDLILQMQHLEASAKKASQARWSQIAADELKSKAMRLAAAAQSEVDEAQKKVAEGEELQHRARTPGLPPLEAGDLLRRGRALIDQYKPALIKARARVNFALDQMDEADRKAWQALQAEALAEAHAQLADDLKQP
jgi:hypothetical protein